MRKRWVTTALFLPVACVHDVYSLRVDEAVRDVVEEVVRDECRTQDCVVDRCWMETDALTLCTVEFAFTSDVQQAAQLWRMATRLHDQHLDVALCGRDSTGTRLVGALLGGVVIGATAVAVHGDKPRPFAGSSVLASAVVGGMYGPTDLSGACDEGLVLQPTMQPEHSW